MRPTQHICGLQEDLGPVCDRLQVPLLPGGQGSLDGFVEQSLTKRRRVQASSYSTKGSRERSEGGETSPQGGLLAPMALSRLTPQLQSPARPTRTRNLSCWRSLRDLQARAACQAWGTGSLSFYTYSASSRGLIRASPHSWGLRPQNPPSGATSPQVPGSGATSPQAQGPHLARPEPQPEIYTCCWHPRRQLPSSPCDASS